MARMPPMSFLDLLILAATLILAAIAGRLNGRSRLGAAFVLAALFAVQLAFEGFYWHWLPAYALAIAAFGFAMRKQPIRRKWLRWTGRMALVGAMLLTLAPWLLFLPVPRLPAPTGPYAVGTEVFRFVDAARPETATADPADRRNVIVQAWYPATTPRGARRVPYIDGLGHLPPTVSVMPSFLMRAYGAIDTHAAADAPVSGRQATWPVVLFSPGYGAPRAAYSSLVADLASRGFVVLTVDHPYEVGVTQLADGRIATPRNDSPVPETVPFAYMIHQQGIRAADLVFVLDQLGRPGAFGPRLSGRLDLERVAAAGHSFGGASSVAAAERDPRIKAAINVDGAFYGDIPDHRLARPVMLIESDRAETGHGQFYLSGAQRLLNNLAAPGYRFQIKRANHYSFTDAPLMLSPPGRFAAARFVGGERGPVETQHATADLIAAFLRQSMMGATDGPVEASRAYRRIEGGRTNPTL